MSWLKLAGRGSGLRTLCLRAFAMAASLGVASAEDEKAETSIRTGAADTPQPTLRLSDENPEVGVPTEEKVETKPESGTEERQEVSAKDNEPVEKDPVKENPGGGNDAPVSRVSLKPDGTGPTVTRQTEAERSRPLSTMDKLEVKTGTSGEDSDASKIGSSIVTRTEARTFTLSVPAPRGQILDRKGYPLAQNRVAYYAAVNFPVIRDADDTAILRYAGERIVHVNRLLGKRWDLSAKVVLGHYENRRWLPLTFSDVLSDQEAEKIRSNPVKGLMLHPVYLRHYPQGAFLAHVLGYVGKRPPRELGPIRPAEPLWGEAIGVEGLEESYETWLKGEPGRISMLFEADGTKLREEMVRRPRPGNNIVTSIDAEMQKIAEQILSEQAKRGSFVIMDVRTGDVLAMASFPQYDPNDFIPAISQKDYSALMNDPEKPLFPRAFRAAYPPASTFKVPVALAALENGTVTETSVFPCPTSWWVGDVQMRNWNKDPEGSMNVCGALARSCNTWFYQVGTMAGTDAVTGMGRRLGFGEKTGIPLRESEGIMPTNRWWREKYTYNMSKGDLANICIGQGQVQATPLQVARAMAAVGNQQYLLKPRLVKQIQDYNSAVIQSLPVEPISELNIDPYYLSVVRQGMKDVVNGGRGTGPRASHERIAVAGKTGTGQWLVANEQNVAWFAGFAPADYPVLSFAVIYEGDPGEKVGGGSKAAPIVGEFLKRYLDNEDNLAEIQSAADEVQILLAGLQTNFPGRPAASSIYGGGGISSEDAGMTQEPVAAPPASRGSGFSRIFRRFRGR